MTCSFYSVFIPSNMQAKRMLKNLRIKVNPSNQEYKITGLSEKPCREQTYDSIINVFQFYMILMLY